MNSKNAVPLKKYVQAILLLATAITMLASLTYLACQQTYRQSANDPQIQIARDVTIDLKAGSQPAELVPAASVDPAISLSPFTVIYDGSGNKLQSSLVSSASLTLPPGVFDWVKIHGEDHFTWQPNSSTRLAAVVVPVSSSQQRYFVLVARNMSETEKRESRLAIDMLMGWLATLGFTAIALYISFWNKDR